MTDATLPSSNRPTPREIVGWLMKGEVALALGVIGIVILLILPIPAFMLDLLLAVSITSSVLILMTSLLIKRPLEFTAFPTVLLVTTRRPSGVKTSALTASAEPDMRMTWPVSTFHEYNIEGPWVKTIRRPSGLNTG